MITNYIAAAMRHAHDELEEPGASYAFIGSIPSCPGVISVGKTLEECREELQSALKGWILVGLKFGDPLPEIDGLTLEVGGVVADDFSAAA